MGIERGMKDSSEVREVQLQHNGDHWQNQPAGCGPPQWARRAIAAVCSFRLKKGLYSSYARERSTRFSGTQPVGPMLTVTLLLTTDNLLKKCGETTVSIKSNQNPSAPCSNSLSHGDHPFHIPGLGLEVRVVLQYFLAFAPYHTNVPHARYLTIASHHPLRRSLTLRHHLLPHFPRGPHKREKLTW